MFRIVNIQPWHRKFQQVLYRPTRDKEYMLTAVSFGEALAAFLVVKTILQLAKDGGQRFSVAAERLWKDFFVVNLLSESRRRRVIWCFK